MRGSALPHRLPPPCGEGSGVGGRREHRASTKARALQCRCVTSRPPSLWLAPHPSSPARGEVLGCVLRAAVVQTPPNTLALAWARAGGAADKSVRWTDLSEKGRAPPTQRSNGPLAAKDARSCTRGAGGELRSNGSGWREWTRSESSHRPHGEPVEPRGRCTALVVHGSTSSP